MPKVPIDYSKTIIYKIEHLENESLVYVGFTTNWDRRKCEHKKNCNNEKNTKHNYKLYQMIRENGGFEMFRMIEVEKFPCSDKREAEKRETEVMKELKSNMNTIQSYVSEEERIEYNRKYCKMYKETNKDSIKEKSREYNKTKYNKEYRASNKDKRKVYDLINKDKIGEYQKEYRASNKVKINEQQKEYRIKNRDKLKEKRRLKYLKEKDELKNKI